MHHTDCGDSEAMCLWCTYKCILLKKFLYSGETFSVLEYNFQYKFLQILSSRSERECFCGGLQKMLAMSMMVVRMMCPDDHQPHLSESGEMFR